MLNILLLHNITKKPTSDFYSVTEDLFKELLIQVNKSSIITKPLECFIKNTPNDNNKQHLTLTFDDGALGNYEVALPLLKEFGLCASFFITVGLIGKNGFMQWNMVEELKDNNLEIGSHTNSHLPLSKLSEDKIWEELHASRCTLEDKLGTEINTLSLPHGDFNKRTITLAKKAGYKLICTSNPGINNSKQIKKGVLYRNPVNIATSIMDIPSCLYPTKFKLILSKFSYGLRKSSKKILGKERYESFRNWSLNLKP